jgi:hypothetical protein
MQFWGIYLVCRLSPAMYDEQDSEKLCSLGLAPAKALCRHGVAALPVLVPSLSPCGNPTDAPPKALRRAGNMPFSQRSAVHQKQALTAI